MSLLRQFPKVASFFNNDEFRASVLINKYLLRDSEGNFLEHSAEEVIDRVCNTLVKHTDNPEYWFEEFKRAINNFQGVCPQGSILAGAGNDQFPQSLSNCFVIDSPEDSMSGIFKTGEEEAQIMKRRGGVGFDISTLRPYNTSVKNAARSSSGAVGWMDYFSNICRSIGQGNRRGALMLTLDVTHPDAELFAKAKQDLMYCTGANVSLKLSNEFMQAVKSRKSFVQKWPVGSDNPTLENKISARKLWEIIYKCAHATAEPGILFWDNAVKTLPAHCYENFKSLAVNPCAELILSAKDSCRLTTICLPNYVQNKFQDSCYFDWDAFIKDVRTAMRILDAVVDAEINAVDSILSKIEKDLTYNKEASVEYKLWEDVRQTALRGRRTGLGTHGLADCLAQLKLRYDNDLALDMINRIYVCLCHTAYDESVEMAIEKGPFPEWNWEVEKECPFFHHFPPQLVEKMSKHGRRNISILTNAPTGSIAALSGVSSGLEPTFRLCYTRRRKINPSDVSSRVDFVDDMGDKWQNYLILDNNVKLYLQTTNQSIHKDASLQVDPEDVEKLLPDYFVTADQIDWYRRVDIQAIMQRYIDHSISSTINLPEDVEPEVVGNLYMRAWEKGLKGLTVYRDNCRTGVLVSDKESNFDQERPHLVVRQQAPVRPQHLPCEVNIVTVAGEEYAVIVGFLGPTVYEVFAGKHSNQLPSKKFQGRIEKQGRKKYLLSYEKDGYIHELDINKYFENPDHAAITRLVSTALRHGTPIAFIVDQLKKSSDSLVGFEKCLARVLTKYAPQEELAKTMQFCEKCESRNVEVRFEEGCATIICHDCNMVNSKCG